MITALLYTIFNRKEMLLKNGKKYVILGEAKDPFPKEAGTKILRGRSG